MEEDEDTSLIEPRNTSETSNNIDGAPLFHEVSEDKLSDDESYDQESEEDSQIEETKNYSDDNDASRSKVQSSTDPSNSVFDKL